MLPLVAHILGDFELVDRGVYLGSTSPGSLQGFDVSIVAPYGDTISKVELPPSESFFTLKSVTQTATTTTKVEINFEAPLDTKTYRKDLGLIVNDRVELSLPVVFLIR